MNSQCKITHEDCDEITHRYHTREQRDERPADIAQEYGIHRDRIKDHANGKCSCGDETVTPEVCQQIKSLIDTVGASHLASMKGVSKEEIKRHATGECRHGD